MIQPSFVGRPVGFKKSRVNQRIMANAVCCNSYMSHIFKLFHYLFILDVFKTNNHFFLSNSKSALET